MSIKIQNNKDIQGEFCLKQVRFVRLSILKLILFAVLSICTCFIMVLVVFRWYKFLKSWLIYSECQVQQSTHVEVHGSDSSIDVVQLNYLQKFNFLQNTIDVQMNVLFFQYKLIKYFIDDSETCQPIAYDYMSHLKVILSAPSIVNYYNSIQTVNGMRNTFGEGAIKIQKPGIFYSLFIQVLKPFYLFITFSICVWIYLNYRIFAGVLIGTTVITVFVNYYTFISFYQKLIELANYTVAVIVLRNFKNQPFDNQSIINIQQKEQVFNNQILPGDVCMLSGGRIPFDAIILGGSLLLNQCSLTGESTAVLKKAVGKDFSHLEKKGVQKDHIVYQGTQIIKINSHVQGTQDIPVLVIRTGFSTSRGQMIRSIKQQNSTVGLQNQTNYYLITIFFLVIIIFFIIFYGFRKDLYTDQERPLKLLDYITIGVPPSLASCITAGILMAIYKLEQKLLYCVSISKITEGGIINRVCFDKTGTLTQNFMGLWGIITSQKFSKQNKVTSPQELGKAQNGIGLAALVCCNSLAYDKDELFGQPMQISTFRQLKGKFTSPTNIQFGDHKWQIVKIFDFDGQMFRMSNICKDLKNGDTYLFCKGSPESIRSIVVDLPTNYNSLLEDITQLGLRVISIAYKSLKDTNAPREVLERDLHFLAFIVFENTVKQTSKFTVSQLKRCKFQVCMITGDNPITAAAISYQLGIVPSTIELKLVNEDFPTGKPMRVSQQFKQLINDVGYVVNSSKAQFLNNLPDQIFNKTLVWARMSPDTKANIVKRYRSIKEGVMMVGDGANDSIALKASNVGLSLAQTEVSIAGHFMSKRLEPDSCLNLLIQTRAGMCIAINIFKITISYSIVQYTTGIAIKFLGQTFAEQQYLIQDICFNFIPMIILPFYVSSQRLSEEKPLKSLINFGILFSLFLVAVDIVVVFVIYYKLFSHLEPAQINIGFVIISNYAISAQILGADWMQPWRVRSHYIVYLYAFLIHFLNGLIILIQRDIYQLPYSSQLPFAVLVGLINEIIMINVQYFGMRWFTLRVIN